MLNTVRDIVYAFRGFKRAPLVALTVVGTVGLGLGLVNVAFTVFNAFLFRVDQVPSVGEMYAVERVRGSDTQSEPFTRTDLEAIRRETAVFTDAYAELAGFDVRVDGRSLLSTLTTGNFFDVVGVKPAIGRTLAPADDEPGAGRAVMVLSDRGWDRLFARAPDVLGRTVLVNGVSLAVVGVMPEGFRGLAIIPPDYWVPLSIAGEIRAGDRGREANVSVRIIGRLRPGMSRETAIAGLAVWSANRLGGGPAERASSLTLVPWRGTIPERSEAMVVTAPLFCGFGLILFIGCANVANLLLARGLGRQREIGIRLSIGASRGRLIRQLLTESLLLALFAAAAGFAISRLVLRLIIEGVVSSWPPEIGDVQLLMPEADWRVLLFLIAGAVIATMAFALVPALHATRIEPVRTMRGEVMRHARPRRTRDVLIGLQVAASALLLISAAVFLRSAVLATSDEPGMRISDTVVIPISNESTRQAIVQAVGDEPTVARVAASGPLMGDAFRGRAETASVKTAVAFQIVSADFFSVFDIPIVRGRAFSADERTPEQSVTIVSETTARTLWPNSDAIGQVVRLEQVPQPSSQAGGPLQEPRTFTVIGVARDVPGFRIAPLPKAVAYLPTDAMRPGTALIARVHGDPNVGRNALLARLTAIDSSIQVGMLTWVTRMETYFLQLGFAFAVGLGGLALLLTVSGLFSVLSYLVEQRTREIGVRMALGATARDVRRLVLRQSVPPVGVGLLLGAGSAIALASVLLTTPAAATIGQIVRVLDPAAYAVSLSVIIAACLLAAAIPAARAARLDPANTLRQD